MYGTTSMEVLKQQHEDRLREAALYRQKKTRLGDRKEPVVPEWVSATLWMPAKVADLLRKFFRAQWNAA